MNIFELKAEIEAYEMIIQFYEHLLETKYGGSDAYIESRIHFLNSKYADALVKRMDIVEGPAISLS
jgi:hypothetical protein